MAKHMWRNRNACAGSEPPKERIDICIGQCLARSRALAFDEQVIGFHLGSVRDPDVGHDLIDEICRNIESTRRVDRFDLSTILKGSPITNMEFVFGHTDILHPERECFSHADGRFIEESDQEAIALIATGIQEKLHLLLGNGLWAKAPGLFLLEKIFLDWRPFRNMVQERFVSPGTSWKVGRGRALDIRYVCFQPPVIVVKAPHYREGVINGSVGTR